MRTSCPHCGVKGTADDSYTGKNVCCPKCQGIFMAVAEQIPEAPVSAGPVDISPPLQAEESVDLQQDHSSMALPHRELAVEVKAKTVAEEFDDLEDLLKSSAQDSGNGTPAGQDEIDLADLSVEDEGEPAESLLGDEPLTPLDVKESLPAALGDDEVLSLIDAPEEALLEPELAADDSLDEAPQVVDEIVIDDQTAEDLLDKKEDIVPELEIPDSIEQEPYGVGRAQCWQCGKLDTEGEPFIAKDGRLYCTTCLPPAGEEKDSAEKLAAGATTIAGLAGAAGAASPGSEDQAEQKADAEDDGQPLYRRFTVFGALREAWDKTRGAKGPVWGGSAMMYLAVFLSFAVVSILTRTFSTMDNPVVGMIGTSFFQFICNMVGTIFMGGLLHMGIQKAAGHAIQWKMVFAGFARAGRIIVAAILSGIMICIGFLLLVLPGIYLCIGYGLSIPLIIEKNFSPWQALEASRKAIHKIWWKVFGLYLCMGIVNVLAALPLGIGLIWTVPMSLVALGVVYRHLFPSEKQI